MSESELSVIEQLNHTPPTFLKMLGGTVIDLDAEARECTFEFNVSTDFCHSIDVVQGGFVTAMLDAAMSHAVFGTDDEISNLSSLEITTRYLAATRAGKLKAVGKVTRATYKTAFLEAYLYDDAGNLTATGQSVAKLVRQKTG